MAVPRSPMAELVVLHIAKTGGTALRDMINASNAAQKTDRIRHLTHRFTLSEAAKDFPEAQIAFFVRDPLDRLISGFNSRLRAGKPRYDVPHRPEETKIFARFPTIADLAQALLERRRGAKAALDQITHTHRGLAHHLGQPRSFQKYRDRIGFIGQTESLVRDAARLHAQYGLDPGATLPQDSVAANVTPPEYQTDLSPEQASALRVYLARDYVLYGLCLQHITRLSTAARRTASD